MTTLRLTLQFLIPLAVVAAGATVMMGLMSMREEQQTKPPEPVVPNVVAVPVSPADVPVTIRTQGSVVPRTSTAVVAQVGGKIEWIDRLRFAEGGIFRAGAPMLRVETVDYENAVTQAKAGVATAEASLQREEAEAALARDEWAALGKTEAPESPLVFREPQVAQARAALASAEATLAQAELNRDRAAIAAPYDCIVLAKLVDEGGYVRPGEPIATIVAIDYVEINLPLSATQLSFTNLEQAYDEDGMPDGGRLAREIPVTFAAQFGGNEWTWAGRIVRVRASQQRDTRQTIVVARVDAPFARDPEQPGRPPLRLEMFLHAEIEGRTLSNCVVLPRAAVRQQDVTDEETGRLVAKPHVVLIRSEQVKVEPEPGADADEPSPPRAEPIGRTPAGNPPPSDAERATETFEWRDVLVTEQIEVVRTEGETVIARAVGSLSGEARVCITPLAVIIEHMQVKVQKLRSETVTDDAAATPTTAAR
jgi:RND family efflux transporter MFP subunit